MDAITLILIASLPLPCERDITVQRLELNNYQTEFNQGEMSQLLAYDLCRDGVARVADVLPIGAWPEGLHQSGRVVWRQPVIVYADGIVWKIRHGGGWQVESSYDREWAERRVIGHEWRRKVFIGKER